MQGTSLKNLYESYKAEGSSPIDGARKFRDKIRDLIGLGVNPLTGRTILLETRKARPENFSLPELTEAMLGSNAEAMFEQRSKWRRHASLLEAGNTAIQPSQFIDISAWDSSVGGLIEAKMIEGYSTPEFIAEQITMHVPTKVNGGKIIGLGRIGDKAEAMAPGQSHPRAQFLERYITWPAPTKYGLAVEVTKEAAFFDLTGSILKQAETVGKEIALRKERRVFAVVIGVSQNPYNYGGTAYNTYLTSGNWINTQSNPLTDWTNVNLAWYLASRMTDQEASQRISIKLDSILCTPYLVPTVDYIRRATSIEPLTSGSSSVYNAGQRTIAPNVTDYYGTSMSNYKVFSSTILEQALTDAADGNISQTNAKQYWWAFEQQGAFAYAENWPFTVTEAPVNDYVMADNDLVLAVFGNERGVPFVYEPRKVIRNTN
ncbi:MAG TPA: hypothetical protein VGP68_14550 [Gemmataceae bacterium]|jgi:hypothetical protein|nr:hypothetical protein [Gemmataceae bacterium]